TISQTVEAVPGPEILGLWVGAGQGEIKLFLEADANHDGKYEFSTSAVPERRDGWQHISLPVTVIDGRLDIRLRAESPNGVGALLDDWALETPHKQSVDSHDIHPEDMQGDFARCIGGFGGTKATTHDPEIWGC